MCGIAGLWLFQSNKNNNLSSLAERMVHPITRRGPDSQGTWTDTTLGICFGHKRLAVIDLSAAGNQPMTSPSGRFIIVFNGEIYNHRQLRVHLEKTSSFPANWQGNSDTETFITAIENHGIVKTLNYCKGMFAFALLDREKRQLHLGRDRFGEKPLYWGHINNYGIGFASELSSFLSLKNFSNCIDSESILNYKIDGFISAPKSIYKNIYQLPPGHLVTIDSTLDGSPMHDLPNPRMWWDTEKEAAESSKIGAVDHLVSKQEKLSNLHNVLKEAIKVESMSDVPLCSFLSGGIDSSLITALLQENAKGNINSFTIAFPDESKFNEAPYARAIANHLGTSHTEVSLTSADAQELIPKLSKIYSEPFADSSQVPTHLLCREARNASLKVALTGDGGDELFGGYNRHRLAPSIHRKLKNLPPYFRKLLKNSINKAPLELLGIASDGLGQQKRQKLAAAIEASQDLENIHAVLSKSCSLNDLLPGMDLSLPQARTAEEQLMLADTLNYLPFDILVKVDRAAMAVGLETRAPFLDYEVAKTAWKLSLDFKICRVKRKTLSKWALREILKLYVPNHLFDRPKAGFAMPIGSWLRTTLKPWADGLLDPTLLSKYGWFNPNEVALLWSQHLKGERDHVARLWPILMAQAWLEEWT